MRAAFSSIAALLVALLLFFASSPTYALKTNSNLMSKLFLIGGGWEDGDGEDGGIFKAMCDNAPRREERDVGQGQPVLIRVAIVTAASSEPNAAENFKKLFEGKSNSNYRIEANWVPITINSTENNKDPKVIRMLDTANILFFSGGDQLVLLRSFTHVDAEKNQLVDSPFLVKLKQLFEKGEILIAGTSAGTAVQASKRATMITGGESWQALVHGAFEEGTTSISYALTYNPHGGFGLFTLGLVDTHFSERGRQGRIVRLADHARFPLAFGVDENSAIFVQSTTSNGQVEKAELQIFGGVHMFNITENLRLRSYGYVNKGSDWHITNAENSYFTSGDQLTVTMNHLTGATTRHVRYAPWKTSLWGREEPKAPKGSKDIFSSVDDDDDELSRKFPRAYVNVALDLVNSKFGNQTFSTTFESSPTFTVQMKRIDSGAYRTHAMQGLEPNSKKNYISYDGLLVDMYTLNTNLN